MLGTGTTIGGGAGTGLGSRGAAGDAHLGNDNFSTNRSGNMGTGAAYNEFEPTGTDTLNSGTNTASGTARG